MANNVLRKIRAIGNVPGAVVFTGEQKVENVQIHYIEYNEEELFEESVSGESIMNYHEPDDALMQWYNICGLHNTELIKEIGTIFNIHPLVLEDVADTNQRPKYEDLDSGNFITIRALKYNPEKIEVTSQQLSFYFGKGFVISFQEEAEDIYENVKKRIRQATGRIRKRGADYLTYTLIDAVTDSYFSIIDELDVFVEKYEDRINRNPHKRIKSDLHTLKMEILEMRKTIFPMSQAIQDFSESESPLINESTYPFLKDLHDHIVQVNDAIENHKDSIANLQELFLSEMSYRMNQVMQVLTVVTTIFIPLSFLTGLYGMNFVNIPELSHPHGYFYLLGVMSIMVLGLLAFFRNKNWL